MNTRFGVLIIAASVMILVGLAGYSQTKYVEKSNEELYGVWINAGYTGIRETYRPQKVVMIRGTYTDFSLLTDNTPAAVGDEEVTSKWTDSEGNIWYRIQGVGTIGGTTFKFLSLHKLSKSAEVRELVDVEVIDFNSGSYPTKVDSTDPSYRIYYRARQ